MTTGDGKKPRRKGKKAPPSKDVNDRAPTQGDKDDAGHLTGQAVLDRLYRIRDASLTAWEDAVTQNDTKAVVAQSTSFERVAGAIKQQENINDIRGIGKNAGVFAIPGLDPARILAAIPKAPEAN